MRATRFMRVGARVGMFGLLLGLSISSVVLQPVSTYGSTIFAGWEAQGGGTGQVSEGYFSNNGTSDMSAANRRNCGFSRCPVLPNNDYAPGVEALNGTYYRSGAASVNKARALVAELRSIYTNGSRFGQREWSRAGSAFIVNTMLDYNIDNPNKTRTISNAMWTELENRLVDRASKGRINWNINFSSRSADGVVRDTYVRQIRNADGVFRWDVVFNGEIMTRNGVIIYNDDGSEAYRLWYLCANPVGTMQGVQPPPSYNLTPIITGNPSVAEGGDRASLTGTIRNADAGTSPTAAWQATTFRVAPNGALPGGSSNSTSSPVAHYGNGATVIQSGSGGFNSSSPALPISQQTIPDVPVGTRVCYTLSVQPYSRANNNWRHSTPFCITIAKKPKLQVIGGDTLVGRGSISPSTIVTSTSQKVISGVPETFGSWGEYAVSATGVITGMASGAGYSGGAPGVNFCTVSYLTFGNAGTSTCQQNTPKGTFNAGAGMPNFSSWFGNGQPLGNVANVDVASGARPSGVYSTNRSITVNASSAVSNRWIVINAPGQTVTITGDITYASGAITSVSQIPQVVIIANRINISESVNRVDAWLVATGVNGTLNTCSQITNPATQLFSNRCSNQLTINGPVSARQLLLYRTAGAGTGANAGDPAEVFNLRPDAYMWAMNYQADSARVQTVYTQELPPRF